MPRKKPIDVREKGIRGELELRDYLRSKGYEARRGGQQGAGGSADAPDVIHNIPGFHIECKRVEAFSCLTRAMAQSVKDAGDKTPTVFSRINRSRWVVSMWADDFLTLLSNPFDP